MDETPSQLPRLIRVGLRCHPAWWRDHYGLDAASTASDLNNRGASSGLQGLTLLMSAASAHLRGSKVLKQSASEAIVEAVEFHPSARWRVLSVAALTFLLIAFGAIGFLAIRGLTLVFSLRPSYVQSVSSTPVETSFDLARAAAFFVPLVVAMTVLGMEFVVLLRAKPPKSHLSQLASTAALLLVMCGCLGAVYLFLDHVYGRYSAIDFLGPIDSLWKVLAGFLVIVALAITGWLILRWNRPRVGQLAVSMLAVAVLIGAPLGRAEPSPVGKTDMTCSIRRTSGTPTPPGFGPPRQPRWRRFSPPKPSPNPQLHSASPTLAVTWLVCCPMTPPGILRGSVDLLS